ncbi:hypothetical protein N7520_003388 [Penicillium odoratum]|uniref:uncharacterized protein n=1 Tax=Penicillium odoratum TaxID=1167516 RepID=UPI002546A917|nr:uncharacterized protein N7520_003388 [Penicillium odoratum]KAJ5768829.1 hypothetical protein N7520_003388 [Penicillium odoratum]
MSSFISSLLTDLGLLTRTPPGHPQLPESESESLRNEQTKSSSVSGLTQPTASHQNSDRGELESIGGDAGSLPSPPFFPIPPKDMDGRTADLPASRPLIEDQNGTERRYDTNNNTTSPHESSTQNDESTEPPNGPPDNDSESRHETRDGNQQSPGQTFDSDELGEISLPADDGMGWLRNKIHAIRALDLDNHEKARRVHGLMTESYNSSRPLPPNSSTLLPPLPDTPASQSLSQVKPLKSSSTSPTLTTSNPKFENLFNLTAEDLQPTYVPRIEPESPVVETGDEDPDTEELYGALLGCQHYMRNVKLQCFTCKKWYTCRFCHDASEDHHLIRRDTENMLCMLCGHPQPADQHCRQCGEQSAQYYCDVCKLWDNDCEKSIYHCNDCGICRIGQGLGKDFFHCQTCCVCLPISIEDTHRCIERSTQCDCPICGDYMFTSPETVVVMRCGHSMHHKCLGEYSKTSFRCPICSKTITNMESTFRNLDRTIGSQPMPSEFKDTKGLIYCNDCGAKSVVKYHWLGLKCDLCESYNTAQIRLLQGDISAVLAEEGVGDPPPRTRSSSLNASEEPTTSLRSLHLNTNPTPDSHLSVPTLAGPDQRTVSYNMTRGRAISPVVSNYFGLPSERESEKPSSLPFFGGPSRADNETDYGALNFLSQKLRDRYGFLTSESIAEGPSEVEEEDEAESEGGSASDEGDEDEDEDDEDEDDEYMDIFGHR